jgi:hypothetical protein
MALQMKMNEEIKTLQAQIASLELEMSKAVGQVEKLSKLQLELDDKYCKIMDNVLSVSKITALQEQRQRQVQRQVELCNHPCNPFSPANMPQPQPVQKIIPVVQPNPTSIVNWEYINWETFMLQGVPYTEL